MYTHPTLPIKNYLKNKSHRPSILQELLEHSKTVEGAKASSHRCDKTAHPPLAAAAPSIPAGRRVPDKRREMWGRRADPPGPPGAGRQLKYHQAASRTSHPGKERGPGPPALLSRLEGRGVAAGDSAPRDNPPCCRKSARGDLRAGLIAIPLS